MRRPLWSSGLKPHTMHIDPRNSQRDKIPFPRRREVSTLHLWIKLPLKHLPYNLEISVVFPMNDLGSSEPRT